MQHAVSVESSFWFFVVLRRGLCVYRGGTLASWRVVMRAGQPIKCFVPLRKLRVG